MRTILGFRWCPSASELDRRSPSFKRCLIIAVINSDAAYLRTKEYMLGMIPCGQDLHSGAHARINFSFVFQKLNEFTD